MATPCIYLLDGNIASGKSTFARLLVRANPKNTIVLNDDAIWTMLGAGDYRQGFRSVLDGDVRRTIRFLAGIALGRGKDVVIDLPAVTPELRNEFWFGTGQAHHYVVTFDWLTPVEHASRRYTSDARGYTFEEWFTAANALDLVREPLGKNDQAWHQVYPHHFNSEVELANGPTPPTPPTGGPSSPPPGTLYYGRTPDDWKARLDHHPDSGSSPGEYASEEEWDAHRLAAYRNYSSS